jgi:hypothetical protein
MILKTIYKILLVMIMNLLAMNIHSQKLASLEVRLSQPAFGIYIPASVDLDDITFVPDSVLNLYEIKGKSRIAVPFQIEQGEQRRLHWMISSGNEANEKHLYELVREKIIQQPSVIATATDGTLLIHRGSQNLLRYYYNTVYPPAGVDTAYKRSGFIHPLWAPKGQVLTRIQPRDHYHHYGIWNPWTAVEYEGEKIDFWNINSRQGTVKFANFTDIVSGPVFAEYGALHEHVVFKKTGGEKVALNEVQSVRVFRPMDDQYLFIIDFNITLNTATDSPFKILEYRYAGLGWRTTEKWDNKNSMVLTSEGKTRKDADGSKAKWCIVQGEIDDDYAGVVMMSYPTNYNFPEPLRIWPENQNGRGDMFANFCPTKDMDWMLYPRQNYVLKYRFLVYNGKLDKDKAESAWNNYAYPPKIKIKKY